MEIYTYLTAIGSNLGDRIGHLQAAVTFLRSHGVIVERQSPLIETAPIGAADQVFVNGAVICRSSLAPDDFMELLLKAESSEGRTRDVHWGNRTVDLDILLVKDPAGTSIAWHSDVLQVPHPRMLERDFVIRPAAAIAGHWTLPGSHLPLTAACRSRGFEPSWGSAAAIPKFVPIVMILGVIVRLFFAARIPLGNDEAYYWDWGRNPQLSYFDHPPFVSWLSWVGEHLVGSIAGVPLAARFLMPFCHVAATVGLWRLCVQVLGRALRWREWPLFIFMVQWVPAFSMGGIMIMPDMGLILFATWALYYVAKIAHEKHLNVRHGLIMGLLLGFAGLNKYHAALIGLGMLSWLAWHRRRRLNLEIPFWLATVGMGLVSIAPVLVWNAQHGWVSFLFQGTRGLSGHGFAMLPALRTLVGEIIFVGPLVIGGLWHAWQQRRHYTMPLAALLLSAALPMLIVLKVFSFSSQTLPHWSMPSLWLLMPFVLLGSYDAPKIKKIATGYGLVFCLLLPLILSFKGTRNEILALTQNRPGGLGELTLWDTAKGDHALSEYLADTSWQKNRPEDCERPYVLATMRWFTAAQMAANLPGNPVVENLDPDKPSYYFFRGNDFRRAGCPFVILTETAHATAIADLTDVDILQKASFEIAGHNDRPLTAVRGYFLPYKSSSGSASGSR